MLAADGINLNDSGNVQIPVTAKTTNTCQTSAINACRADMLTVWRRLHIEVDSMGNVSGNSASGSVPGQYIPAGTVTVSLVPNNPLEPNRFENGRILIESRSLTVIASDPANGVNANTEDSVTVINPKAFNLLPSSTMFKLYDDDDFNGNDGTTARPLHGDEGENVDESSDSLVKSNDISCSAIVISDCNTFAPAYVKPFYDLPGSREDTAFVANVNVSVNPLTQEPPPSEIQAVFNFSNDSYEANTSFWTVYLNGAYQYDERVDRDPNTQGGVLGIVDAINGKGALIFMETTRPSEIANATGRPISRVYTVAHELGHLFNGQHFDYFPLGTTNPANAGLMSTSTYRTSGVFNDVTLNKIRGGEFVENGVTKRITHP